MHGLGRQYGCVRTGEAYVFLHIPADPTILQFSLCVPNQDVQADDESRLRRTAVGQMLAFTLQALAAESLKSGMTQRTNSFQLGMLNTWTSCAISLKRFASHRRPRIIGLLTGNEIQRHIIPVPVLAVNQAYLPRIARQVKVATVTRICLRRLPQQLRAVDRVAEKVVNINPPAGPNGHNPTGEQNKNRSTQPFCTMACIRGMVNRDPLDKNCPNWQHHGGPRHRMGPREFTRKLHCQLVQNRNKGFEPLHICGRTGYLMKATLLSHGYTVVIKATTKERQHALKAEVDSYRRLRRLQGYQIPVCLGDFEPRITYWYHGKLISHMMILNWSGTRLQKIINNENSDFFHRERDKCLTVLRSHGVVHRDKEWRNMYAVGRTDRAFGCH